MTDDAAGHGQDRLCPGRVDPAACHTEELLVLGAAAQATARLEDFGPGAQRGGGPGIAAEVGQAVAANLLVLAIGPQKDERLEPAAQQAAVVTGWLAAALVDRARNYRRHPDA